jgi:hypothetical protein
MNFDSLRFVSERSDASETLLSVVMPEKPGGFRELMTCFEKRNVTEFAYRYGDTQASWPIRTTKKLSRTHLASMFFSLSLSLVLWPRLSPLAPLLLLTELKWRVRRCAAKSPPHTFLCV